MGSVSLVGANTGNWTFSSEKREFPALILPFTFHTWFSMKQTLPVLFTPSNLKLSIIFFSPVCVNSLHVSCRFEKATLMMANYHLCKGAFVIITFVNMNKTNILVPNIGYYFRKKNSLMGHPSRLQKTCFVIWNAEGSQVRFYQKSKERF